VFSVSYIAAAYLAMKDVWTFALAFALGTARNAATSVSSPGRGHA
jgi:hypothetical protein